MNFVDLLVIKILSLWFPRHGGGRDIPLGDGKGKIRTLKARVSYNRCDVEYCSDAVLFTRNYNSEL